MMNIKEFLSELEQFAPLKISQKWIENGRYDNSGLLVRCTEKASNVLFSLDLSAKSIKKAIEYKCDTIVTHHPAIYKPIFGLDEDEFGPSLTKALRSNLNVISMHINLDFAKDGIDHQLAQGLGAKNSKILSLIDSENGYGRVSEVDAILLKDFIKKVKKNFNTNQIICYGKKTDEIKKVASFCGAGGSDAVEFAMGKGDCDLIVTSDLAHHEITAIIENGYNLMVLTHYSAEQYGFRKFYEMVSKRLVGKVKTHYFADTRFM